MSEYVWFFFLAGVILMLIEVLLVPGLGIAGILGFLAVMVGVYYVGLEHGALWGIISFVVCLLVVLGAFLLLFKTSAANWMVMKTEMKAKDSQMEKLRPGLRGRSLTPLYPVGRALFVLEGEEVAIDVSAAGQYIEKDLELEIERLEGNRVFVKTFQN